MIWATLLLVVAVAATGIWTGSTRLLLFVVCPAGLGEWRVRTVPYWEYVRWVIYVGGAVGVWRYLPLTVISLVAAFTKDERRPAGWGTRSGPPRRPGRRRCRRSGPPPGRPGPRSVEGTRPPLPAAA